jgi:DNA-binding Lrp family transcriptional regulator
MPELSAKAKRVLYVLSGEASDGYALQQRTGLSAQELLDALNELLADGTIQIEGGLDLETIGRIYVWVPPSRKNYAAMISGKALK